MVNYKNSKIYRIYDVETNEQYIGSTTQRLSKRLSSHKNNYIQWLKGNRSFTTSFNIIKGGNYRIELIEECPCDNKEQLCKREGYYIRKENCVNKRIAGRSDKERYYDNQEKEKEKCRKYYKNNKDIRKKYNEINREQIRKKRNKVHNCECGSSYTASNRARHFRTKKHQSFINGNN